MISFYPFNTYSELAFLAYIFVWIIGASIGSFINVVVDRLIREESISGRSHCDFCKHSLSPLDLVPIFSYLFLRGKCQYCHKKLSLQYPVVEFLTGMLFVFVLIYAKEASLIHLVLYWGIVSSAWIIFISDLKYQLIADGVQLSLFVFAIILKMINGATLFTIGFDLVGGILVMLPIGLISLMSRERAMGLGDVILAFLIGFLFGVAKGFLVLYCGFILGAIVGVILLLLRKKKMKSSISFGPFLIMGMGVVVVWGREIVALISSLYRL